VRPLARGSIAVYWWELGTKVCVCVDYPRALDWGSLCELKLEEEAGVSCEGDRKGEGAFIAS